MNYPDDWLCKECERPFKLHCKRGEPSSKDGSPWLDNWCNEKSTDEEFRTGYLFRFKPMDNLTFIEFTAKQRGITEGNKVD